MPLLNSLFSGVSGLRNHQSMMDVISNNIANVNTIGYKGSRVTFSDTFNRIIRYGSNPTETTGGVNTFQVGLGMRINTVDRTWNQGTFEGTGVTTDLALQGPGLFILQSNGERFYTRAGAFIFDADGRLVSTQNGAIVQGKVANKEGLIPPGNYLEDIVVDPNMRLPAVATSRVSWGGNLKSASPLTRSENYLQTGNINSSIAIGDSVTDSNTVYDENGNKYTFTVTYTKTADNTYTMEYRLRDSNNNVVVGPTSQTVVFDGTTGQLLTVNGQPPAVIQIQNAQLGINFNFNMTGITQNNSTTTIASTVDSNRQPTIITGSVTIFDSLGNSHILTIKYTKVADNSWRWSASVPESSGTLSGNAGSISFNPDGSINAIIPNPPVLTFTPTGGASAQNIILNFGEGFNGITQTSANSVVSALSQDGSAAASLSNLSIDKYGYIVGVFTNGQSRQLAQIMIATFPNLNGLISVGENLYTVSANTGDPLIGEPGESTGTTIQSGALEQSNVDLSEEFTRMIVSQRGFQASARVVTVSDTLLQEITNLVR
ncbi:MAG: flagellar hook-basal body complex protein [Ignavibacterium sp.]|nr:flagellar hook-basal body complex protein [Ignavibacterium sp.]MDW8374129.1 flagellar hook-basal body complex protein [Ignavibacteriales bacterium]